MSTKIGEHKGHRFHGAPERFEVVADFVWNRFGRNIKYIADVAGGKGMLAKILNSKYNYETDVIDPRGWTLKGINSRKEEFKPELASYYDLVIGLHPDEATRPIVESAAITKTLLIPCCNFWDKTKKLGRDALVNEIGKFYDEKGIKYEKITLNFNSPKNIGLLTIN